MTKQTDLRWRLALVLLPLPVATLGLALHGPIPQDPAYHLFADSRSWLAVANFGDVASNIGFLLAGLAGLAFVLRPTERSIQAFEQPWERLPLALFFLGVFLTTFSSCYYHLEPSNERLVWDRLPMTLGFMGIFCAMLGDRFDWRIGVGLTAPLALLALGSVLWWARTESLGQGDLRPYALVQFYPMLAMLFLLLLFPSRYSRGSDYWGVLLWYLAAKIAEHWDSAIFGFGEALGTGPLISGHSLKHLLAAAAAWWVLRMLRGRRLITGEAMSAQR